MLAILVNGIYSTTLSSMSSPHLLQCSSKFFSSISYTRLLRKIVYFPWQYQMKSIFFRTSPCDFFILMIVSYCGILLLKGVIGERSWRCSSFLVFFRLFSSNSFYFFASISYRLVSFYSRFSSLSRYSQVFMRNSSENASQFKNRFILLMIQSLCKVMKCLLMISTSMIYSRFSLTGFKNSSKLSSVIFYLLSLIFQGSILFQMY